MKTDHYAGYECVTTEKRFEAWLAAIDVEGEPFAFDTETTSTTPTVAEVVGVSLAIDDETACYIPVGHRRVDRNTLTVEYVIDRLRPILANKRVPKVLHNAVYDALVLAKYDAPLAGIEDTMLMAYAYEARRHNQGVGMDELAMRYLKYRTIQFDEVFRPDLGHETFGDICLDHATAYAAEDSDVTLRLSKVLREKLAGKPDEDGYRDDALLTVYEKIDRPLIDPLVDMAYNGVLVDTRKLAKLGAEWSARRDTLNGEAIAAAGVEFNLASPASVADLLYHQLGLPVLGYTDGGSPSTDEATLNLLDGDHPVIAHILEHKKLAKLISSFTESLPNKVNRTTGRVHGSINHAFTRTRRFSSSNPNLQQIPTRTDEGKQIRECFIASRGNKLISCDYSQIELRVLAHLSRDPALVQAFHRGEDIHAATAVAVWGLGKYDGGDPLHKSRRLAAKTINFGLLYGQGPTALAKSIGVALEEALDFIDAYFEKLPGVEEWIEREKARARARGYVETIFEARLWVDAIRSSDKGMRAYGERQSINTIVQGSAADLMRLAMPAVRNAILRPFPDAQLVLTVHDELLLEAPEDEAEEVAKVVKGAMETCADDWIDWRVPIVAEASIGNNWKEAK